MTDLTQAKIWDLKKAVAKHLADAYLEEDFKSGHYAAGEDKIPVYTQPKSFICRMHWMYEDIINGKS